MNYLAKPLYYKMYEEASAILIEHLPFYSYMLQRCVLIWTPNQTKTAGVRVMPRGTLELLINPEFFASLIAEERAGLLLHEVLHLIGKHMKRGLGLDDHDRANRGMDTEINQIVPISWLPPGALMPDNQKIPLPFNEPFEVYYNMLPPTPTKEKKGKGKGGEETGQGQKGKGQNDSGEGSSQDDGGPFVIDDHDGGPFVIDDHDVMRTGIQDEEQVERAINDAVERAVEDTLRTHGSGHIPAEISQMLEEAQKKKQVPWYEVFRAFLGRKITFNKAFTRKRPSRRLGLLSAGKTNAMGPKVLFGTDVSGSVSDKAYQVLMGEALSATEHFPDKVDMFFFDYEVFKDEVRLGDQKTIPRRPGHGGTNFEAVMQYAADRKPDLLIILTDGDCSPPKTDPGCAVMWVIVGGKDNPALEGQRCVLPADESELGEVQI